MILDFIWWVFVFYVSVMLMCAFFLWLYEHIFILKKFRWRDSGELLVYLIIGIIMPHYILAGFFHWYRFVVSDFKDQIENAQNDDNNP
jgi:hypothetical protein